MDPSTSVILVEALYSFKGKNNDELNFKKGAIITVTQNDDETWWEGTYDGTTGWFPANYVRPFHSSDNKGSLSNGHTELQSPAGEQQMYRALVLRSLLDSERQYLADVHHLLSECLRPLIAHKKSSWEPLRRLVEQLERVAGVHEALLGRVEHEGEQPSADQRVGGAFLAMAADALAFEHRQYCLLHPKGVCSLQQHQTEVNQFVEGTNLCEENCDGQKKPGLLVLTTGLSKPFRRLQQYAGLLQELHRHLPEAHKDRGDAHRAAKIMADLSASCQSARRQKELELEVVTQELAGYDRGTLSALGEVVFMGSVAVLPDHTDRYIVLFPHHLVVLSVSARMSNFIFQSEHNLSEISCRSLDDCSQYKNAFELSGAKLNRLVVLCQSKEDQMQWVQRLSQPPPLMPAFSAPSAPDVADKNQLSPKLPPRMPVAGKQAGEFLRQQPSVLPSHTRTPEASKVPAGGPKPWSLCDLRPTPPIRPSHLARLRTSRKDERLHDDDNLLLRVVEAYCASAATRPAPGADSSYSRDHDVRLDPASPPDARMLIEVEHLKSELSRLSHDHRQLKQQFERERASNKFLRSVAQQIVPPPPLN